MKYLIPLLLATALHAADWPHWRGPDYNGISTEDVPSSFAGDGPKQLWKAQVGIGFSSFAVAGGRVFTLGWAEEKDTVFSFDAASGKVLWQHSYAADQGDKYYEGGPSATPCVDGEYVYTLGKWGDAFCFDAKSGKIVWQKNFAKDLSIEAPGWGFAGSPRVQGEVLYLNIGSHGLAVKKLSGEVLWSSDGSVETGYSTPVLAKFGPQPLLLVANTKAYSAVDPVTGKEQWSIAWPTRYGINAADPIVSGDELFISTGYGKGCVLYSLKSGKSELRWQNRDMRTQMSPCVLIKGHLYGIDGDESSKTALKCMELATGKVKWQEPTQKMGSVVAAKDTLIVLGGTGELRIAKASPDGFDATATAQILKGKCWTVPVLANGVLYARNAAGDVVALSMK